VLTKLSIAVYIIVFVLQEDRRKCIKIKNSATLFSDKEKEYFNEIAGFLRASVSINAFILQNDKNMIHKTVSYPYIEKV